MRVGGVSSSSPSELRGGMGGAGLLGGGRTSSSIWTGRNPARERGREGDGERERERGREGERGRGGKGERGREGEGDREEEERVRG